MAEEYSFFDAELVDGQPDRVYNAEEWATYFRQFVHTGIFPDGGVPGLEVTAGNGDMSVNIEIGEAFITGYLYRNTAQLLKDVPAADASNDRIDRVVIVLDRSPDVRKIYSEIKLGDPAADPVPPSLKRSGYVYEISLAQIYVAAGVTSITSSDLTDEREDQDAAGLASFLVNITPDEASYINPMSETTTGDNYPVGVTTFDVNDDDSWPNNYGTVLNVKADNDRFTQWFYYHGYTDSYIGAYFRHYHSNNGWSEWKEVTTRADLDGHANDTDIHVTQAFKEDIKETERKQDRLLAHHEALFDIDSRAVPNSGKFYDLFDGNNTLSAGKIDNNKTRATAALSASDTIIPVESTSGFDVGEEVTVYAVDETNGETQERVIIQSIDGTNSELTVTALANSYPDGAQVARSMSVEDTDLQRLEFGGWSTEKQYAEEHTDVVAADYSTGGNGGRKLVRLDNGWIVAGVYDSFDDTIYVFVSEDEGETFQQSFYISAGNTIYDWALSSYGNQLIVINLYGSGAVQYRVNDITDVINEDKSAFADNLDGGYVDQNQDDLNSISLTINKDKTELHAAWTSKNSTYPDQFNVRYAEGTIESDGSVTWGSIEYITSSTTSSASTPSVIVNHNNNPVVFYVFGNNVWARYYNGSTWDSSKVYDGSGYTQSSPSSIFVPSVVNGLTNGRIWVAWNGMDATYTTTDNIKLAYSDDGGETWSGLVDITAQSSDGHQKYPSITADKYNKVFISWMGQVSGSSYRVRYIENNDGSGWGDITTLPGTSRRIDPSSMFDVNFNLEFSVPMMIYNETTNGEVEFTGTWLEGYIEPLLKNDVRVEIYPPGDNADEIAAWIMRTLGATVDASLSIVGDTDDESYVSMTKSTVNIDGDTDEDEFLGDTDTPNSKVTMRITMTRSATTDNEYLKTLLGAISEA